MLLMAPQAPLSDTFPATEAVLGFVHDATEKSIRPRPDILSISSFYLSLSNLHLRRKNCPRHLYLEVKEYLGKIQLQFSALDTAPGPGGTFLSQFGIDRLTVSND